MIVTEVGYNFTNSDECWNLIMKFQSSSISNCWIMIFHVPANQQISLKIKLKKITSVK